MKIDIAERVKILWDFMLKHQEIDRLNEETSSRILEQTDRIIDRLLEKSQSKPDSYLGGANLYPESDKSQKYHREGCDPNIPRSYPCNCDEESKPDKLQDKSFSELPEQEQKNIISRAARASNRDQKELADKSKPDKECECGGRITLEKVCEHCGIFYHPMGESKLKLQRLLEWVKNDAVKEYSDFVFTNPSIILRDLTVKIKKLMDEK